VPRLDFWYKIKDTKFMKNRLKIRRFFFCHLYNPNQ